MSIGEKNGFLGKIFGSLANGFPEWLKNIQDNIPASNPAVSAHKTDIVDEYICLQKNEKGECISFRNGGMAQATAVTYTVAALIKMIIDALKEEKVSGKEVAGLLADENVYNTLWRMTEYWLDRKGEYAEDIDSVAQFLFRLVEEEVKSPKYPMEWSETPQNIRNAAKLIFKIALLKGIGEEMREKTLQAVSQKGPLGIFFEGLIIEDLGDDTPLGTKYRSSTSKGRRLGEELTRMARQGGEFGKYLVDLLISTAESFFKREGPISKGGTRAIHILEWLGAESGPMEKYVIEVILTRGLEGNQTFVAKVENSLAWIVMDTLSGEAREKLVLSLLDIAAGGKNERAEAAKRALVKMSQTNPDVMSILTSHEVLLGSSSVSKKGYGEVLLEVITEGKFESSIKDASFREILEEFLSKSDLFKKARILSRMVEFAKEVANYVVKSDVWRIASGYSGNYHVMEAIKQGLYDLERQIGGMWEKSLAESVEYKFGLEIPIIVKGDSGHLDALNVSISSLLGGAKAEQIVTSGVTIKESPKFSPDYIEKLKKAQKIVETMMELKAREKARTKP